jgi:hypothetical protein
MTYGIHGQRSGRVHDVHARCASIDHNPGLLSDHLRRGHVRHHQVAVHVHAEFARQANVLDRDIRFRAVGRDPDQVSAQFGGPFQLTLGTDSWLERDGELGPLDRLPGRGQQVVV